MKIDKRKMEAAMARLCFSVKDLIAHGVSGNTIVRIKQGYEVTTKTAGRIATALKVDILDLIE